MTFSQMKEELGLTVIPEGIIPHIQDNRFHNDDGSIRSHNIVIAIRCSVSPLSSKPKIMEPSISCFTWLFPNETIYLNLMPGTRDFIKCIDLQASYSIY